MPRREVATDAGNVQGCILLDRTLRQYGPEAKPIRKLIRRVLVSKVGLSWVENDVQAANRARAEGAPAVASSEQVQHMLIALSPTNDIQLTLRSRALNVSSELAQTRWLLFAQKGTSIPVPILVVLVSWLAVIFCSLGLFAPRNATVSRSFFFAHLRSQAASP